MVPAETATEPTVDDHHPLSDPQDCEAVAPRLQEVDQGTGIPRLHLDHRHRRVKIALSNLHPRLLVLVYHPLEGQHAIPVVGVGVEKLGEEVAAVCC
jgi:hypothetical protein